MRTLLLFYIALSFGAGLIYLDLAVHELANLHLLSRYLLSIYGGFMGWEIFEYVVESRGKKVDGNTGSEGG